MLLLPNLEFVSVIKMSNPVLFTMAYMGEHSEKIFCLLSFSPFIFSFSVVQIVHFLENISFFSSLLAFGQTCIFLFEKTKKLDSFGYEYQNWAKITTVRIFAPPPFTSISQKIQLYSDFSILNSTSKC